MFSCWFAINFEHGELKDEDDNREEESSDKDDVGEDEESKSHDLDSADLTGGGCCHRGHQLLHRSLKDPTLHKQSSVLKYL